MVTTRSWLRMAALLVVACGAAACGRRDVRFDVDNARAHVNMLAGTIGTRPVGSEANAKARNYIIDQLKLYGFDVRVQETDAVRPEFATTTHVANVIAFKAGAQPEAIGIVAHYDSRPEAPGAADDGLGTAVALEAGRVLASKQPRKYSLLVLLTDGEEAGLMGAAAAVKDPEILDRLRAYLNVEAIGSAGPVVLFESGPAALPLLKAWVSGSPQPHGASYATEIYKRLPNDTDFTMLRGAGISGLNLASIGDSYAYHTNRDTPERLRNEALRQAGETVVGTIEALDADGELPRRGASDDGARFFDIGQQSAFVVGPLTSRALTIVAVLIGLLAWLKLLRALFQSGALRVIVSFIWMALAVAASVGAMLGAAWLLRHGREVFHPWYAHPDRLLLLLVMSGIAGWWYITRLMFVLPEGGRSLRAPAAVWVVALPIWAALAAYIEYVAPAAALMWSVPLLVAAIALAMVPSRVPMLVRFASLLIAAVVCMIWLRDSHDLFVFLVSIFGRLPIVTPFWVYPAFVVLTALIIAPPFLAMLTGMIKGRFLTSVASGALLVLLATATGLAYFADAYTPSRPLRRIARYTSDTAAGPTAAHAWWEVGGNEPGLDLNVTPPEAPRWRPQPPHTPPPTSIAVYPIQAAFVHRSDADAIDPPADIGMSAVTQGDTTELDVTVVPKMESLTATFVLPEGLEPTQANLAGHAIHVPTNDAPAHWLARFVAIPSTGIAFRATVPTALAPRLADTTVIITATRLPGTNQPPVPTWLPTDRAAWSLTAQWIIKPPLSTKTEPVPPPAPPPLPGAPLPSPTLPLQPPSAVPPQPPQTP